MVKAINAKGCASFSRKVLDELGGWVAEFGAKGLAWAKAKAEGWQSPIGKFLTDAEKERVSSILELEQGDLALFVADSKAVATNVLGRLRLELAAASGPAEARRFPFCVGNPLPVAGVRRGGSPLRGRASPLYRAAGRGSAPSEGAARRTSGPAPMTSC